MVFYKKIRPKESFPLLFMYRQPRKRFSPEQESLDVWQRLTRLLLAAVFVGIAILTMSFFAPQIEKQRAMEADNTDLACVRDDLRRQLDKRLNQQRLLRTDPKYMEQFARDRLDMQKEDELIIRMDYGSGNTRFVPNR